MNNIYQKLADEAHRQEDYFHGLRVLWETMAEKVDEDHDCHIMADGTGHCNHPSHPDGPEE